MGSALDPENPLKEAVNPLQYSCMENPIDIGAWSDMTEYARMPRPFTKNLEREV